MPHIQAELGRLPPGIRLDGELYKHGLNFQTHLSLIKRQAIHDDYYQIQYHVFDIQSDETFEHRLNTLTTLINNLGSAFITLVPTKLIAKSQIDLLAKECFTDYEGAMLRDPDSLYKYNARSIGLQKYKWKGMNEFQIVDIVCSSTGREMGAAILVCSIPNSKLTFRARIRGMSIEERQAIYKHKASFIGYWTRVTHEGFGESGKPLKPRAEGLFRTPTGHQ
jgi:ATP-dependent DNA ligase